MTKFLTFLRACLTLIEVLSIHPPRTRENQIDKDQDLDETLFI